MPFGIGTGMFIPAISESLITIGGFGGVVGAGRPDAPFGLVVDVSIARPDIPRIPGIGGTAGAFFAGADCAEATDANMRDAATMQRIPRAFLLLS